MLSTSRREPRRSSGEYTTLSEVLHVCRERRALVAGLTAALVLGVVVASLFQTPVYTARAVVDIRPQEGLGPTYDSQSFLDSVVGAVSGEKLTREVARKAGWKGRIGDFQRRLDVERFTAQGGGAGLEVRFSGPNAEEAARSANAYASVFVEKVGKLGKNRLAGGTLNAGASVGQRAVPPEWKSSPRILLRAAVALLSGLLIGVGSALVLENRASDWRGVRDAELTLKVPVLGAIPEYGAAGEETRA